MSESGFVFCAVAFALAGTVFARSSERWSYGLLLGGMCLVASARPEGNLWQGAGVLLALVVYWGSWRREWVKIVGTMALMVGMLSITKTSHSGLLLYSSMVQFTPEDSKVAPGLGPYIRPTKELYRAKRAERVGDDVVKASRPIQVALAAYAADHPHAKIGLSLTKKARKKPEAGAVESADPEDDDAPTLDIRHGNNLSNLCRRLAIEAARQHLGELPGYAWRKFLARSHDDPGGRIEDYTFHWKQAFSLTGHPNISTTLGRALTGGSLDTPAQATDFVYAKYDLNQVAWYNTLEARWQAAINAWHLPDTYYSPAYNLPGLTIFHLAGMLGAVAALFLPGPARRFHWAFVPTLLGAYFIVILTAAVIPRHRFVLETFWLLYGFMLLDGAAAALAFLAGKTFRRGVPAPAASTPVSTDAPQPALPR